MRTPRKRAPASIPARLDWKPSLDQLADIGEKYCPKLTAAMLAASARQAALALKDETERVGAVMLTGDACKGQQWREQLIWIVERYHDRVAQESAIAFRHNIAVAASALLAAFDGPIDLQSRRTAMSDIRSALPTSAEPDAIHAILSAVSNLETAASNAALALKQEAAEAAPFGSAWCRFVLDMKSFAKRNGLPHNVGASEPDAADKYAPFAEFLLAVNKSLPRHLRYAKANSTFIKDAKAAVRNGQKAAAQLAQGNSATSA